MSSQKIPGNEPSMQAPEVAHYSNLEPYYHQSPSYVKPEQDPSVQQQQQKALPDTPPARQQQRILGLTPALFWVIVLIAVLLVAGALGGGIGGGLAAQRKSSSPSPTSTSPASSTSTSSSSSSSSTSSSSSLPRVTFTPPGSAYNDSCPGSDKTSYTPSDYTSTTGAPYTINNIKLSFTIQCYTNYPGSAAYGNPGVFDLQQITRNVSTIYDCLGQCALFNVNIPGGDRNTSNICDAVVYGTGILPSSGVTGDVAQCWLKNGVQSSNAQNNTQSDFPAASALLVNPAAFY